jgi:expansin (peptidoglycan-binding protein)
MGIIKMEIKNMKNLIKMEKRMGNGLVGIKMGKEVVKQTMNQEMESLSYGTKKGK